MYINCNINGIILEGDYMSDWNKYIKQFISNGNKVEVKKVKTYYKCKICRG